MKQVGPILKRISILFYVFVGLFIIETLYTGINTFSNGLKVGYDSASAVNVVDVSLFVLICKFVFSLIMLAAALAAVVLFVMLLVSIGRSIARKNIFDLRTVKLINRYAVVYGITLGLLFIFYLIFDGNPELSTNRYESIIMDMSTIVILLIFGQVLRLGNILKQEQELTI